jgi:hypothetical protein
LGNDGGIKISVHIIWHNVVVYISFV